MRKIDANLINTKCLPELHQELAGMIGLPNTLELGEAYNGVRVYIPTIAHEDHMIAQLVGYESLEELVRQFGGEEIQFPKIDAAVRQIKVRMISEMLEARMSTKDIALNTGYTQRRVQQIKSDLRINFDDQYSLF